LPIGCVAMPPSTNKQIISHLILTSVADLY
jgi:hypothetical protein